METMIPILIQVAITWLTETSIIVASSLAVTNSVSFNTLLSAISWSSNSCIRLEAISRFSLRYLEVLFLPLVVRRARVSFTCFATSSSLTSCLITGFLKRSLLLFLRLLLPPWLLPPPLLPPLPCTFGLWAAKPEVATLFTSTFSLLIRFRFFLFPAASTLSFTPPFCSFESSLRISLMIASFINFFWSWRIFSFSSRSRRFSSFDFFLGRVDWFNAARSIWPITLIFAPNSGWRILNISSSLEVSFSTSTVVSGAISADTAFTGCSMLLCSSAFTGATSTFGSSLITSSTTFSTSAGCFSTIGSGSFTGSGFTASGCFTGSACLTGSTCLATGSAWTGATTSSTFTSGSFFTSGWATGRSSTVSFFCSGSFSTFSVLRPFNLSKSIFPTGLNFGRASSGTTVLITSSDFGFSGCFSKPSIDTDALLRSLFWRSWMKRSDSSLRFLSVLNSFTSIAYCSSLILVLGLASTVCPFFCRNSTTVAIPTFKSLVTLFNLIVIF